MAKPQFMRTQYVRSAHGIVLAVYPSTDTTLDIELQRMTTSSTWAQLATWGVNGLRLNRYEDLLPLSTLTYSYRARHLRSGVKESAWSNTVAATPTALTGPGPPDVPHLVAGRDSSAGGLTKTIKIPAAELVPRRGSSYDWYFAGAWAALSSQTGDAPSTRSMVAPLILPPGVTVTKFQARLYAQTTSDHSQASFFRVSDESTFTNLTTLTAASSDAGSWATYDSSAGFSESISTDENYVIRFLGWSTANGINSRFMWARITYSMPDLRNAY